LRADRPRTEVLELGDEACWERFELIFWWDGIEGSLSFIGLVGYQPVGLRYVRMPLGGGMNWRGQKKPNLAVRLLGDW
jgi:hypothetical protein